MADPSANLIGEGAGAESSVSWRFAPRMETEVLAYAGRFDDPFWAEFDVDGDTRTIALPDGTVLTETLSHQSAAGYSYTAAGLPGIHDYIGTFAVMADSVATEFAWTTAFRSADPASLARMLEIIAAAAGAIGARLAARFPASGSTEPSPPAGLS